MVSQLLKTKLHLPSTHASLVPRPRLLARLDEPARLTLLSAPAGFGKTTLLANWVRQNNRPVAWLSLDADDNDPLRFWSYVVSALQTVQAEIGQTALAWLQSPQPPPVDSVLTGLINEITDTHTDWALVLDDFHVITEPQINQHLVFFLDHLPAQMHLILTTRADPPWPLARLRVRGEMIELRTQDLRFTLDEASIFMRTAMGLDLSAQDMAVLDQRTEGWIAGLQLAALSIQGREDVTGFVQAFSGSHRFVLDYLVEEVLDRQPEPIRAFLLKSSILERLTASLCDAVTGDERLGSQAILTYLERANLFLLSLDDERKWYRYHHLFADLLSNRLAQRHPDQVSVLHCRASAWYEEQGMIAQAIRHGLQAGDVDRGERLIKHNALAMILHGEPRALISALEKLPHETIRSRSWLSVGYAWALAYTNRFDAAEALLDDVEDMLAQRPPAEPAETRRITGQVAAVRSHVISYKGDLEHAIDLAHTALALLPQDDPGTRAFATSLLSGLLSRAGKSAAAIPLLEQVIAASQAAGDLPTALFAYSRLAGHLSVLGQFDQLVKTGQEAMRLNEEYARQTGHRSPAAAYACQLAGGAMYYRNDLDAAERYIKESLDLYAQAGQPLGLADGYLSLVHVLQARGEPGAALDLMHKAHRITERVSPWFHSFGLAWEALLHVQQGNLSPAVDWAQACGLRFDDEVSLHTYVRHFILAHVLLAQGQDSARKREEALSLSDRLVHLAESAKANRYLIESLVVRALAFQAQDRLDEALADLGRALTVAEPEGYVRTFIDQGAPMQALLKSALSRGLSTAYVSKLLAEWAKEPTATPSTERPPSQPLIDPLSDRELEVLRLLPTELTSTEIADHLYVSRNTVRSHIAHIYDKLNVHSRAHAVQRAQELGLL
ncbi:MAG: helix-turn-helix transcriptional regulator [Anaerolineae bacterium]|nr:helix-turn-helix transcriptional regulator [Anaerolineae bacterium]